MARIFNGGTVPLVVRWGDGVVGPGESVEVDDPDTFGPPWTVDLEAERKLDRKPAARRKKAAATVNSESEEDR